MVATDIKNVNLHYDLFNSCLYSRETINIFFVNQVSGLVKNLNIRIYSGTINVINFKLCVMVLNIVLDLFMPLSMTLTIFQGHSNVKQFN